MVFKVGGAMRGTGTPNRWDQFTAVRACRRPVNAYTTTAPDEDLPRPRRSHTGHRNSLTLSRDHADRRHVPVQPLLSCRTDG
ncbi:hypothetical protein [Streptomyces sp. NPDC057280]|uniref:hypothetical protein n=1 Tax=Streptomyces sp. NPDC057280 TaxID=3346081 RepID=UPI00363CAC50